MAQRRKRRRVRGRRGESTYAKATVDKVGEEVMGKIDIEFLNKN